MYHDRIIGLIYLFIPYPLKNLICTEYLSRVGGQKIKNVKFNRRQRQFFIIIDTFVRCSI